MSGCADGLLCGRKDAGGYENVHQSDFKKVQPSELHQLVEAESGESPPYPDEENKDTCDLCKKSRDVNKPEDRSRQCHG